MASQLGPETPRPFSVISEQYQNDLALIKSDFPELYSFGESYDKQLLRLILKYSEVNIDDRVCYIGPVKGSIARGLEKEFALIHPVEEVSPNTVIYGSCQGDRDIPVNIINMGAEEFFKEVALTCDHGGRFDSIIIKDSLEYFERESLRSLFSNIMRSLSAFGKVVILHRPSSMITLPYYSEAKRRAEETDVPYMDIITDFQLLGHDVQWEIETLKVVIPRLKWLSLMYHRYPNHLEAISATDVCGGLRELTEGPFKYAGEMVEFYDRLLVITVSHSLGGGGANDAAAACKRHGGSAIVANPPPVQYRLPITHDIQPYVKRGSETRRSTVPTEWWGTVHKDKWVQVDSSKIPSRRINHYI